LLGCNYFETEEVSQSEQFFQAAVQHFAELAPSDASRFLNELQDIYNMLGIIECNREHCARALGYFEKSVDVYNRMMATKTGDGDGEPKHPTRSFPDWLKQPEAQVFTFVIDGGINLHKAEQNHTMSYFFMA
jgi:hypothetical protein